MDAIEAIRNYLQVSDRIASSGQPDIAQFRDISAAGFEAVINLAMPDSDDAIPEERAIVTSLGMSYVHIPVPFDAPDRLHLDEFLAAMQALSARRVWVHCALNYRASAFLYLYYRLALGVPPQAARKVMLASWTPDEVWRTFMAIQAGDLA